MEKAADLLLALSDSLLYFLFLWSWQAALLIAAVWLTLKLDRSRTAVVRHRIWLFGLIAVAILPLVGAADDLIPLPPPPGPFSYVAEIPSAVSAALSPPRSTTGSAHSETVADYGEAAVIRPRFAKWTSVFWSVLFLAWMGGVVSALYRFCVSSWKLGRVCRNAQAVTPAQLDCSGIDWSSQSRRVMIGLSSDVRSPLLAGLVRPMILLPADIKLWTNVDERTAILRHELIHLRRRDHYVNLFQVLLNAVFFIHPLVRYACSRLSAERELACDEGVLNLGTGPAVYAESILKVVERNTLPDAVHQPAAFASRKTLEKRIEMITRVGRPNVNSRCWPFLVLPVLVMTVVSWLLLSGRPVVAGARPGKGEAGTEGPPDRTSQWAETGMRDFTAGGSLPGAGEVFDRYVEALGGRSAIEKVSSRVVSGTMEGEDLQGTRSGSFQEYTKAPNKYLMIKGPSSFGTFKVGFNGVSGWRWSEYWGFGGEWDDYDGGLAKQRCDFYRDIRLRTIYAKMAVIGKGRMRDREVIVLEGSPEEGIVDRMYFDAQTGLLLRLNHSIQGWKHVFEDYFDDYREVDGVQMPFTRRRTSPDRYVVTVSEVRQNIPIDDAEFDAPGNNLTQGLRRLFHGRLHVRNPFRRNSR